MILKIERGFGKREFDSRSRKRERDIAVFFPEWKDFAVKAYETEVYWVGGDSKEIVHALETEILDDPHCVVVFDGELRPETHGDLKPSAAQKLWCLEKRFRPGVTDNVAQVLTEGLRLAAGRDLPAASGSRLWLLLPSHVKQDDVSRYAAEVFCNDLIEQVRIVTSDSQDEGVAQVLALRAAGEGAKLSPNDAYSHVSLTKLDDAALERLSEERLWALSRDEMRAIQAHFREQGREPTDVEMEIIAQTWSEHCKHKIFAADIEVNNLRDDVELPARVSSVFKTYIRGATEELSRSGAVTFLESVFSDNAGVIKVTDEWDVAIKVETHNSPSALDPYGGSLTGIVGVNRDILGVGLGALPIANLDVFCVGELDAKPPLPPRLHHPRRILEGVRLGVEHGGNKSGIPTVTGAVVHHPGYLGKPLVYCGTLGLLPRGTKRNLLEKHIASGDYVVMVGGRIGKDGIHGATFSSLELNESSPVSAVQLGDPLTQRRVWDFLLEARDEGLYDAVTDNGAGGLSSSVGELAQFCGKQGGARIDVAKAKTKYVGLTAFELVVSESQERMTVSVPPKHLERFLSLATSRGVECSVLGEFQDSGRFEVLYNGAEVAKLNLGFLHEGVPTLKLKAQVVPAETPSQGYGIASGLRSQVRDLKALLSAVLSHPNVRSRREIVRQYDHEVQARTVRKPYGSRHQGAPGDGGTLRISRETYEGVAVGLGLAPHVAAFDAKLAAELALDEAVRNTVAAGGDPDHMALVDNFCWPDPLPSSSNPDAEEKLGALVVTCERLYAGSLAWKMPFISGKDSMKNDYRMGGVKISVPPTVLVTAMGRVPDVRPVPAGQALSAGLKMIWAAAGGRVNELKLDLAQSKEFYRTIHRLTREGKISGIHDVADGGWLGTAAEMLFGSNLGAEITAQIPDPFFEPASAFVILTDDEAAVMAALAQHKPLLAGVITSKPELRFNDVTWPLEQLECAYHGEASPQDGVPVVDKASKRKPAPRGAELSALVLAGDGINCQVETADAARDGGFTPTIVHVNDLLKRPELLSKAHLFAIPGGFSFGDELGSGKVLALKLKFGLQNELQGLLKRGGAVIGICNGFQVLTRLGVFGRDVVLAHNRQGTFINRWVGLEVTGQSIFTDGLDKGGVIQLPMRHGEGRLTGPGEAQCVLRYTEDVNGAWNQAAALSTFGGRVLGVMPHPEAFWSAELKPPGLAPSPLGTVLFENAYTVLSKEKRS